MTSPLIWCYVQADVIRITGKGGGGSGLVRRGRRRRRRRRRKGVLILMAWNLWYASSAAAAAARQLLRCLPRERVGYERTPLLPTMYLLCM